MKRILPLILTILLIPGMLAVPARADELSMWVNILDYGYANNSLSNKVSLEADGHMQIHFQEPSGLNSEYLDIIFRSDGTNIRIAGGEAWFQILSLGDDLYRAYGFHDRDSIYVDVVYDSGSYIEFLSLRSLPVPINTYHLSATGTVSVYGEGSTTQQVINYTGAGAPGNYATFSTSVEARSLTFTANVDLFGFERYDYIQLTLDGYMSSLSSIVCKIGNLEVPYEINFVNTSSGNDVELVIAVLTFDCRNIPTNAQSGYVTLSGEVPYPYTGSIRIQSCYGFLEIEPPSPLVYWFTQLQQWLGGLTHQTIDSITGLGSSIGGWFDSLRTSILNLHYEIIVYGQQIVSSVTTWGQNIVNAINPPTDTDDMRNEVENIRDQMQDANDVMNELQRPDIDDVFHEVQLDIGTGSPFSDIMSGLFANDFIVAIVTGSLAFTLFGILVG